MWARIPPAAAAAAVAARAARGWRERTERAFVMWGGLGFVELGRGGKVLLCSFCVRGCFGSVDCGWRMKGCEGDNKVRLVAACKGLDD